MPVETRRSDPTPAGRPLRSTVERLFAYWLISTALLALVCIVLIVYLRGAISRQNELLDRLNGRLERLEKSPPPSAPLAPQQTLDLAPSAPAEQPRPTPTPAAPAPRTEPANPAAPQSQPSEAGQGRAQPLDDATARATLDRVLSEPRDGIATLSNPAAAAVLLDRVRDERSKLPLTPATWSRLALVARLLGRDAEADACARRLQGDAAAQAAYLGPAIRVLLDRGRARDAQALVDELDSLPSPPPATPLLRALVANELGQVALADGALRALPAPEKLSAADRLAAARLLLDLDRSAASEALTASLGEAPANLAALRDFLTAVRVGRAGRLVEALAALDFVAAHLDVTAQAALARALRLRTYDIDVWRGTTLAEAGKLDEARTALLAAATADPSRPEALVALARVEIRAGRPDRARAQLQNATTLAPQLPAAWESLAVVDLNEGYPERAIESASKALEIQDDRTVCLFLRALARAKLEQRAETADDLRRLFAVDRTFIQAASDAPAIARLFDRAELDELAQPGATSAPATQPG